jgi:putative hemolysin
VNQNLIFVGFLLFVGGLVSIPLQKGKMMKKAILAISVILIAGCTSQSEQNPAPGLSNPASIYCIKQGGKLSIVNSGNGEVGYCNLPNKQRVEEWELYRSNGGK